MQENIRALCNDLSDESGRADETTPIETEPEKGLKKSRRSRFWLMAVAEQGGCQVEVVNYSDALMQLGGVGALLRYLSPEQYACAGTAKAGKPVC